VSRPDPSAEPDQAPPPPVEPSPAPSPAAPGAAGASAPAAAPGTAGPSRPADAGRRGLGADWTAVLVAAVVVLLAVVGLLPSIPFLVK
jgi:hypothetical protein